MTATEIQLDLGTVTMRCSTDEIAATLAALLGEMRSVIPRLRTDERDVLRQIMSRDSGTLTVADVFPDFARESEGHKTLRRLRAAQFIRPAATGRWSPDEPIEVKPFARLMWDHVGEDEIFAGVAPVAPVPMAAPAEDEIDLGGTDEPGPAAAAAHPFLEEEVPAEEPAAAEQHAVEEEVVFQEEPAAAEQEPAGSEEEVLLGDEPAAAGAEEEVVDLQDVEEEKAEKPAAKSAKSAKSAKPAAAKFEDDNLDLGDLDDLYAYAQEEVRGKK
jgi:hypothetical protein